MKCSYYRDSRCSSCELLDKSYAETLLLKQKTCEELFPEAVSVMKPAVGPAQTEEGRNKAKLAVFQRGNDVLFGYYDKAANPIELENCPLHAKALNDLLPSLKDCIQKYNLIPYDLSTKKGELKYIILSQCSEGLLVRFILRSKESLDRLKKAVKELIALPFNIKVVTANIQPIHQAIFEGDEEIILTDEQRVGHQFDEFILLLGARSFFQVTPEMARALYSELAAELRIDRPASLIDLYCGVGAFSFYASRWCKDVTGVEISKEAIESARVANTLNQTDIKFIAADAEEYLLKAERSFAAVLVNPPRRGLNTTIIQKIKESGAEFLYYSSCNPETLKRDYLELKDSFSIKSMRVFDMFPFTKHFEVLMVLKRN